MQSGGCCSRTASSAWRKVRAATGSSTAPTATPRPSPNRSPSSPGPASAASDARKREPACARVALRPQRTPVGERGSAGGGRLGLDLDGGLLADEHAAGLEGLVPGEPEVLTVHLALGAEADGLPTPRGGRSAF